MALRELHLFAGAGGGILGGILLGHVPVCAVELEEYPRNVLLQRQRDGILPWFPVWDDVRTFDGEPWRGHVDVICGGFPCQDISAAGKGAGIEGERSGLWSEFARIIGEVRPRFVFVENSPMLTSRGLGRVLGDLAQMGYGFKWGVLGAHHAGAPHSRERIWIYATNTPSLGFHANAIQTTFAIKREVWGEYQFNSLLDGCHTWESSKRGIDYLGDGLADWMGQSKSAGNGQVPAVAALAWETLSERGGLI